MNKRTVTQDVLGVASRRVWMPLLAALVTICAAAAALAMSASPALASGSRSCSVSVTWEGDGGQVNSDPCANEIRIMSVCASEGTDYSNVVESAGANLAIADYESWATGCEDGAGEAPVDSIWYHTPDGNWTRFGSAGIYDGDSQTSTASFTE